MEKRLSLEDLNEFASSFWKYVNDHRVFAFHGQMGAGKTTFISALCRYKGSKDVTSSPTFSIINEYNYPVKGQNGVIYHIDLYRLNNEQDVIQAGVEDCIYSDAICMVEWPGKAPSLFDRNTVHVYMEVISETERHISIQLPTPL